MITNHKYAGHGIDAAKMREESIKQSSDTRFGPAPRIVLHLHGHNDKQECERTIHEVYVNGEDVGGNDW